jgi:hypothetical protein
MSSLISETSFVVSYHHVNSFVIQTTCLEREGQRMPPEVAYLHFFNWGTSLLVLLILLLLLLLLLLRTLLLERGDEESLWTNKMHAMWIYLYQIASACVSFVPNSYRINLVVLLVSHTSCKH